MNDKWVLNAKQALVWDGVKLAILICGVYLVEHIVEARKDGF